VVEVERQELLVGLVQVVVVVPPQCLKSAVKPGLLEVPVAVSVETYPPALTVRNN
jgi:hypothetical protein